VNDEVKRKRHRSLLRPAFAEEGLLSYANLAWSQPSANRRSLTLARLNYADLPNLILC